MDLEISVFENIKCGHCKFLYKNIHTNKNLSSEMALEGCSVKRCSVCLNLRAWTTMSQLLFFHLWQTLLFFAQFLNS